MKPKIAQFLRMFFGISILWFVAGGLTLGGIQAYRDAAGETVAAVGPRGVADHNPSLGTYVSFPLGSADVASVNPYQKHKGYVLRVKAAENVILFFDEQIHETFRERGTIRVDGRVVMGLPGVLRTSLLAFAPGVESDEAVIIIHGKTRSSELRIAWMVFAGAFLALLVSLTLFRAYREHSPKRTGGTGTGFFEGLASRYPAVFEKLEKVKLNGTGVSILDYHERRADGSSLVTKWLTLFFMPIAPLWRERIKPGRESLRLWIPFVWHTETFAYQSLERLAVDGTRRARVYLFYYLFVLPFSTGPLMGFLIWLGVSSTQISAGRFWLIAGLLVLWGMFVFLLEHWIMKRPR
ncbi:MAG TPA: hypothetical protein DCO77_04285 [Nitrospiraceae bacterium]|nr:hypothetical protein [Nitrospiraceae bacterium]